MFVIFLFNLSLYCYMITEIKFETERTGKRIKEKFKLDSNVNN